MTDAKKLNALLGEMIHYNAGDIARIHHFLQVYAFAKAIGEAENLPGNLQFILEAAALTHDIGIKVSEQKYRSCAGQYQQLEGPPIARELLNRLGFTAEVTERVCYLIAHHHTYSGIDGLDYQILVEADFLVNIEGDQIPLSKVPSIRDQIFRTKTGIDFLTACYLPVQ